MTRHATKKDGNHNEIAKELTGRGFQVIDTSGVGPNCIPGFPDMIVTTRTNCVSVLLEIKMPGEGLSSAEEKFHRMYKGPLGIAYSIAEAVAVMEWFERGYVTKEAEIPF